MKARVKYGYRIGAGKANRSVWELDRERWASYRSSTVAARSQGNGL